ncbi:hypothetical protein AB6G58_10350 [Providencia huaxiensis]
MTNHQIMRRLLYLSLFIISPYGYTENQLLSSAQESIQFEQKQRLESELTQRSLLEKQSTIPIEDASLPLIKIKYVSLSMGSNLSAQHALAAQYKPN